MTAPRTISRELLIEILGTLGDHIWAMQLAGNPYAAGQAGEQRAALAQALRFESPEQAGRDAADVFLPPTRFVELTHDDMFRLTGAASAFAISSTHTPAAADLDRLAESFIALAKEWTADKRDPAR